MAAFLWRIKSLKIDVLIRVVSVVTEICTLLDNRNLSLLLFFFVVIFLFCMNNFCASNFCVYVCESVFVCVRERVSVCMCVCLCN